uniref:Uncharacterized protein LOC114336831 n=1 Tax=Diabrotica virgifera virgifera TaxID=50390 RepID=A0A6P7G235_DIAVI
MDPTRFYGKQKETHILLPDIDSDLDYSSDDSITDETYLPDMLQDSSSSDDQIVEGDQLGQQADSSDDEDLPPPLSDLTNNQIPICSNYGKKKIDLKWTNSKNEAAQTPLWGAHLQE